MEKLDWWNSVPDHKARAIVWSAIRTLRKSGGGPFTHREVRWLIEDVMGLPHDSLRGDLSAIHEWTKAQCRTLVVRLLVRGMI